MKNIVLFLLFSLSIAAQDFDFRNTEPFYFDAIVFHSENEDSSKVDAFVMIPYEKLNFKNTNDKFGANYDLVVSVYDTNAMKIKSERITRTVITDDYFTSLGGTGEFEKASMRFYLPKGDFQIKAEFIDKFSNEAYQKVRNITVLDFESFDFSISGVMLISTIEERNGKFKITPYLSDDIGMLEDGFFVFFEAYNFNQKYDSVRFNYEYFVDDKKIAFSEPEMKYVGDDISRIYLKIDIPENLKTGSAKLRINVYKKDGETNEENVIAAAQRSLKFQKSLRSRLFTDIDKAIEQLIYVAHSDEIRYIEDAESEKEKIERFKEFWDKKDPSPGTKRNEAMMEYYQRVEYANRNFRSYANGWRTDKGMVFIVFGSPYSINRSQSFSDGRVYETWQYTSNREFIFVDNSGFGDFRLVRPMTVTEKYEFRRNG